MRFSYPWVEMNVISFVVRSVKYSKVRINTYLAVAWLQFVVHRDPYLSHRRFVRPRLSACLGARTANLPPMLWNACLRMTTHTAIGHGVDNVLRSRAWSQLIFDHLGYEAKPNIIVNQAIKYTYKINNVPQIRRLEI